MSPSQVNYQEFFEFSLDAIVCSDETGHITLWNPAAERMFGYGASEAIGQPLTILIPHETQEQHNAGFKHFLLTGEPVILGKVIEVYARKKDASIFPVELSLSSKETPQGYKFSAILRDVTARKKLETQLKSNASKLQSIFSSISNISVQGYDKNRKVVFWNKASERIYGYSYEEAIGQHLEDLIIPAAMRENVVSSVNRWLKDDKAIPNGELTLRDKKGAPIHVYSSHIMTEDAHGNKEMFCIDIDMSSQKETLAALQKSNAQLLALINTSPDLIFLKDKDGVYLSCNQRFAKLYGTSEKNIIGKTDYDFVDKSSADFFRGKDKLAIELGHPSTNEEEITFASDGHSEIVETIKTPIHNSTGELVGVLGVARDITERKRSEILKEQTTQILTMIATGEPCLKIYNAIALTYESRHPGMRCSMLELRANKLVHGGAPSMPQEYCDAVNGLKNGPSVGSCGTSTFTGKRVLVEDIATDPKWADIKGSALPHGLRCCWSEPIKSATGKVLGAFGMYYDHPAMPNEEELNDLESAAILTGIVMERERQQASLRKLSQAIEQAGESILITDAKGAIEYVNPMFTKMTGYESHEVLGENPRILKSGNQNDQYYKDLWTTITNGKVWQSAIIDRRKDGSQYPAVMSISPIFGDDGNITHYIGIQQDMTDYKTLEQQFQQAQKMDAIGTLVGGIAHDFNNMLASVTANLYLAKTKIHKQPDVIQKLDSAEEVSFRAADMIQQLLTFARKDSVSIKPLPLLPFIKETTKFLHTSIPENIVMQQDICNESLQIMGDNTQLHQILMNLINNACDALQTTVEPCITIRLKSFYANDIFIKNHIGLKVGNYACLSIKDNGAGIPKHQIEHLFEPFFTTKDEGKGTGLGLAMVFGAVKTHNGYIHVDSTEGEGACFNIYLPLLEVKKPAVTTSKELTVAKGKGETILLVDDQQQVIDTIKEVLESFDYHVFTACNGKEAVELFKAHAENIDLVILDVVMPIMSGHEAARLIREMKPQVKIIMATGYDKNTQPKLKGEVIIAKPFDIAEMSHLVRQRLDD